MDKIFPDNDKDWLSVSVNVGSVKEPPPLDSVTVFPDCDIVCGTSVKVGKVNEPPPLESVMVFPDCEMVCNSLVTLPSISSIFGLGRFTGALATPFIVVTN